MAVLNGLAPDGGLYIPRELPKMPFSAAEAAKMDVYELTARVVSQYISDLPYDSVLRAVREGYIGRFDDERLSPLVPVGGAHVLELWHGPTSAFKDMALCVLPRLMAASREYNNISDELLILTATSGDTGKAALAGFANAPHTRIIVFYPEKGVSEVQKAQMVTQEGENVRVCAVRGDFDDAQRGVKSALSAFGAPGKRASSANSINIGRLAPQAAYYYNAYAELVRSGSIAPGDRVDFIVPTGNFGNILAGYMAKRAGLPVGRLVCASNANDVLCEFLSSGVYNRASRSLIKTDSPSMDILVSSNLERLLFLMAGTGAAEGNAALVRGLMEALRESGRYSVPADMLSRIQEVFLSGSADDAKARETIGRVYREQGYLMDPHTAVAWSVYESMKDELENPVVLSTASPFKFAPAMLAALGEPAIANGFMAMERLSSLTGRRIPAGLASLRSKPALHSDIVDRNGIEGYIKSIL